MAKRFYSSHNSLMRKPKASKEGNQSIQPEPPWKRFLNTANVFLSLFFAGFSTYLAMDNSNIKMQLDKQDSLLIVEHTLLIKQDLLVNQLKEIVLENQQQNKSLKDLSKLTINHLFTSERQMNLLASAEQPHLIFEDLRFTPGRGGVAYKGGNTYRARDIVDFDKFKLNFILKNTSSTDAHDINLSFILYAEEYKDSAVKHINLTLNSLQNKVLNIDFGLESVSEQNKRSRDSYFLKITSKTYNKVMQRFDVDNQYFLISEVSDKSGTNYIFEQLTEKRFKIIIKGPWHYDDEF